ncbi:hypothetical protein KM043_002283 [Ampulex compressa]|nr:hypothetical protein KM043_002283 [Ampulex compressa]
MCIPKWEPLSPSRSSSEDDLPKFGTMINSPIFFTTPYKLRDPVIVLERCDKIWETLQLIKNVQDKAIDNATDDIEEPPDVSDATTTSNLAYIKYQPVIGNDNAALPNFRFYVKTKKKLFHCVTCGKEYAENRSLRLHSEKIHGIIIPLQRVKKSIVKPDDKKLDTQMDTSDKRDSPVNGLQTFTDSASPVNLPVQESSIGKQSEINNNPNPAIKSKDNSLQVDAVNSQRQKDVPMKNIKDQPVLINKEVKETTVQNPNVPQSPKKLDPTLCILCKTRVQCMQTHLTKYHKIARPTAVIKELENTLLLGADTLTEGKLPKNVKERRSMSSISLSHTRKDEDVQPKRRSADNVGNSAKRIKSNTETSADVTNTLDPEQKREFQCSICHAWYQTAVGLSNHQRIHRVRGETEENYETVKYRNRKSSSLNRRTASAMPDNPTPRLPTPDGDHTDRTDNTLPQQEHGENDQREGAETLDQLRTTSRNRRYTAAEITCACGRSFRNPHTLYVHKTTCKFLSSDEVENITGNSSERDSGIGISITIKKKNDSYEIVGKDSGDESKSKDSGFSKDCDVSSDLSDFAAEDCTSQKSDNAELEIMESSKYSKHHSIMKIEFVEEDIDVDIEGNSQNGPLNNDGKDKIGYASGNRNSRRQTVRSGERKRVRNNPFRKVPTLKEICNNVLKQHNMAEMANAKINKSNGTAYCLCGKPFASLKNMWLHIIKIHPPLLKCGYCNEEFINVKLFDDHQCNQDGKTIGAEFKTCCPHCKITVDSYQQFDDHVASQHCDPVASHQCYKCLKRFPDDFQRQVHCRKEHSGAFCFVCNKTFHVCSHPKHRKCYRSVGYQGCTHAMENQSTQKKKKTETARFAYADTMEAVRSHDDDDNDDDDDADDNGGGGGGHLGNVADRRRL